MPALSERSNLFARLRAGPAVVLCLLFLALGPTLPRSVYDGLFFLSGALHPPSGLALSTVFRMASDGWAPVSAATTLGFIGCVIGVMLKTSRPRLNLHRALAASLLLILLTGVFENGLAWAQAIVPLIVAFTLAMFVDRDALGTSLGVSGLLWLAVNAIWGANDPTGMRFEGIAGNPNRYVAATLLLAGFWVQLLLRGRARQPKAILFAALAGYTLYALWQTSSAQALVAIAAAVAVSLIALLGRLVGTVIATCVGLLLASIAALATSGWTLTPDLATLSGRTPIFQAAWAEASANLWFGTGSTRVLAAADADRATHSVFLTYVLLGGIACAALWALLIAALWWKCLTPRIPATLVIIPAISVLQFVQNLEMMPLLWLVVAWLPERRQHAQA